MDRFKGLKIGMQSFTLRGFDLDGAAERTKQLGLQFIELGKKHCDPKDAATAAKAKALCAANGIAINATGVGPFTADEAANRVWFEHAKRLGVKVISANPTLDSLDCLDRLCEEYDIMIAIHNHGPGSLWPDIKTIEAGIKNHCSRIGLCVDTGHFLRVPEDPIKVMKHFKDRVHGLHLKDMDVDVDKKHGKEYIVGQGPLDLKGVLALCLEWKFQGPISIEYEVHPENPMDDLKVALGNIEKALA